MPHPLVLQLRFTRSEFMRALNGVTDEEARRHFGPMNCISWIIGHLAWQEQLYWLTRAQGQIIIPEVNTLAANGAPASTPPLDEMWQAWRTITEAVDPYLDSLTTEGLSTYMIVNGRPHWESVGSMVRRMTYHYWYHMGESQAIRQMLGHTNLPSFVGAIHDEAPYIAEGATEAVPPPVITKGEFIDAQHSARAEWDALIARIPESRMTEAGVNGDWSMKDLIAHVTWYEREMVDIIQQRALAGSDLWGVESSVRNAAIYAANKNRTLQDVLDESRQVYQQLIAGLESLTDDDLNNASHFRDMPPSWLPWQVIASNAYEHYPQHVPDVRAWMIKSNVSA